MHRPAAVVVALAGLVLAARYPLGAGWGIAGCLASAAFVYLTRDLWIAAIPVVLVVGDLYPWTGSLLVTESDLLLMAMLAVLLWRAASEAPLLSWHRRGWVVWLPLAIAVGVSVVRGWNVLPPGSVSDALSIYSSQWNALRVAKGFIWGLVLAQLLSGALERCGRRLDVFARGMQASALVVAVIVVCERAMAGGVFDFQHLYRATGPFFSMHTGGQHIDAFWALALPFLFFPSPRATWLDWLVRGFLLALSLYAVVATMSRGVIVLAGFVVMTLALMTVLSARELPRRGLFYLFGVVATILVISVGAVLFYSGPIKSRFADSAGDLQTRWNQWRQLHLAAHHDWVSTTIGNGVGTVPSIAASAFGEPARQAELVTEADGGVVLRLRPGKAVYVEQIVDSTAPSPWTVTARLRSDAAVTLNSHVCEKTLFDSFRCLEASFTGAGTPSAWRPISWTVDIDRLTSKGNSWPSSPVTLAFSASGEDGMIDMADLHLTDAAGASLLENADFQAGSSYWFFTSDNHSAWRAENMWVQLYLEMGWLGVVSVGWLLFRTLATLLVAAAAFRDNRLWVSAVSIMGFLMIGLFGSLLDVPWLTMLLCAVLGASQGYFRNLSSSLPS